jgi:hypothetical protein
MRTTITLDPDVEAMVRELMREGNLSFKDAVNRAIRAGLSAGGGERFSTPTRDMGTPSVPLEKALSLAGALEDEELVRKLSMQK